MSVIAHAENWNPSTRHRGIRRMVAEAMGVSEAGLVSRSRKRKLAHARQMACWVLRRWDAKLSFPVIARVVGLTDHSTVIHGIKQVEIRRARDEDFRKLSEVLLGNARMVTAQNLAVFGPPDLRREPSVVRSRHLKEIRQANPNAFANLWEAAERAKLARANGYITNEALGRDVKRRDELSADDHCALKRRKATLDLGAALRAAVKRGELGHVAA